jgi:hypothetical protein
MASLGRLGEPHGQRLRDLRSLGRLIVASCLAGVAPNVARHIDFAPSLLQPLKYPFDLFSSIGYNWMIL